MWSVWLVFCDCGFHCICLLMDKDKKLPDGRDWLRGKLGLVLMDGSMLSKCLIQFSIDGWGCVPSLFFDLRPNYGGDNEDTVDLLQKVPSMHCCTQCPRTFSKPLLIHASIRDSWTLTDKSGSFSYGVTAPFFWVLVCIKLFLCPPKEGKGSLIKDKRNVIIFKY